MKNSKNEREIEMQGEKNAAAELNRGRRVAAELAKCAIFVVLMVVSAFIKIPFPLVPLTFQTVVAVLAGLLLGPLYGTAAVGVYIFMSLRAAAGLPMWCSRRSGIFSVLRRQPLLRGRFAEGAKPRR